tara:strand:- start:294 stop:818 length:525 start_codon:yes stop_codon:yes gene_type:complete
LNSKIIIFFLLLIYSTTTQATNIRVVDLQLLINENIYLRNLIKEIEKDQISHREKFSIIEIELQNELKNINESKVILDNEEIDILINKYNEDLNNFNFEVQRFNSYYEKELNSFKNTILEKILEILEDFSLENKVDLVLDSNNYILSSNSINITDLILNELNKITFDISFEKYK